MRPRGLVYGTALLLVSNIFVKGLGFFYRVALVRLLGAEGIGLVEMVTPIYSFLLVLAGLGLQPALAQCVAGSGGPRAGLYFRAALLTLTLSGLLMTVLAGLFSPWLAQYFATDDRIALSLRLVLPAILIISLASAWRGWFQGRRELGALGMSQNIEQVLRVVLGLLLVRSLLGRGLVTAAAGVSLATVVGELAGFIYLIVRRLLQGRARGSGSGWGHEQDGYWSASQLLAAARQLLSYGMPITGGRLVNSVIMLLQAYLIPFCLQQAGYSIPAATEIYGRFSGVALTLLHLPGVFAAALATAVMPAVAQNMRQPQALRLCIVRPLQATIICTLPSMAVLLVYAAPLCAGLFNNAPAAPILRWLCLGGVFFYMQFTLAAVLQGLGEVRRLLVNNLAAGIVLLLGIVLLVPLPGLGVYGAAIAADLSWLCGFVLHLDAVRRRVGLSLPWGRLLGLPLLGVGAGGAVWYLLHILTAQAGLSGGRSALLGLGGAALCYGVFLLLALAGRSGVRK